MYRSLLCASALCAIGAAHAAGDTQHLSLTVYNSDLALVQDQRHLDVQAGRSKIEFKDVSTGIKPQTVALSGRGLSIVEQNFDYDLLTPNKMMEKAVGHQVQIVRTNPGNGAQTTETATVLSVNEGVVLKIGNRVEVLRDDGVPARVIFNSIPENLRASPTLSVTVNADGGGARDATLSYLTTGLSWKADYVALYDEKQARMHFQGWVTLTNNSGTTFSDARTQLVAGDINLSNNAQEYFQRQRRGNDNQGYGQQGTPSTNTLADYYIYTLPERLNIASSQSKQVSFLELASVPAAKAYSYEAYDFESSTLARHAAVSLKFASANAAVPAGIVRVYMRDESGDPKFVGEDDISHTPSGANIEVRTGSAFDVTVQPTVTASEKLPGNTTR